MFESFLEKLIINNFGQYISGLDRNKLHLAIWSGNIVIEDVNIKPDILEFFDIPINLRFSTMGRLQLQIPWSSLSKTPVEIILDKIFIIATPKPQKDWKLQDYNWVSRQLRVLNNFAKTCIENYLEKQKALQKKAEEKDGFFDKLSMKILDNLQLTIKNIHFRFEDESSKFSFGITLDEIIMITTDESWKKSFIDRTEEKNKDKPMNKLLRLSNLGIYWNSRESNFLGSLEKFVIIEKLNRMIMKEEAANLSNLEYIISISAEARLVQNHYTNFELPEYSLSIELVRAIELHLKNEQFEQIIKSFETYIQYNKMQMLERKKLKKLDQTTIDNYREKFMEIFPIIQQSELKNLDCLNTENKEIFKTILSSISSEELCIWAKKSLKDIQKNLKVQELEKIKKKNESKWFRWGSNNSSESEGYSQLNSSEYQEIEEFIEKNFGESEEATSQAKKFIRPSDKPWFKLDFSLQGGSIYLSKKNKNEHQEGVKLYWCGFHLQLMNFTNGLRMELTLKEIGIHMITEYVGNKTPIITPILYKGHKVVKENFLRFVYEKNPSGRKEDQSFICGVDSMELVYHPLAFYRLFGFFEVKTKDEAFKTVAWEQIEKLQDISQERVQDILSNSLRLKVNIEINAPIIIIPFKHNNDMASECWVIDLGSFILHSDDEYKHSKQYYELFKLNLSKMKMQYYPQRSLIPSQVVRFQNKNLKLLEEESKEKENYSNEMSFDEENKNKEIFNVIDEYTIDIEIYKLRSGLLKDPIRLKENLQAIFVKIEFPKFQIQLNKNIYQNIINLPATLHFADLENLELLQDEKKALLNSEIKSGQIKRRGNTYKAWKPNYVIFSGGYLYFYNSSKDLSPLYYLYIKKAIISTQINELEPNSFIIKTKSEECYLACETYEEMMSWVEILKEKIEDFSIKTADDLPIPKKKKNSIKNTENLEEVSIGAQFHMKEFEVSILENESYGKKNDPWVRFSLKNCEISFTQRPQDFEVACQIATLFIEDKVVEYVNDEYKKLVLSQSLNKKCSLDIRLKFIENGHPEYKGVDLDLVMNCQSLAINWKPQTLLKLGEYIKILKDYQKKKAEAEIITNPLNPGIGYLQKGEELRDSFPEGVQGAVLMKKMECLKDEEKVLLKAHFLIEEITINFLHKQTHVCLAKGFLQNTEVDFLLRDLMFKIDGSLSNLQVFDMTNYPKTLHSNEKNNYKEIKPYELLGLKNSEENKKKLLNMQIISFENMYKKIKGNITTLFFLDIASVVFKYHHQPIMRIVDYALIQVVSLITDPLYLTLNEEFYQNHKDINKYEPKKFVGGSEEVYQRLDYPTFLYLKITFSEPIIQLKPTPDSEDYLELCMSKIFLENDQYINMSRLMNQKKEAINSQNINGLPLVWCENYRIQASDLRIYLNKQGETKAELSVPVLLNLSVEKILMTDEYQWVLIQKVLKKELSLNNNYIIKGVLSPIILKLYRDEYLFIIKMLFHNITFDDFKDKWFIYDFDIVSQYDPTPITFQLDFLNITLFAMHSKTNMPFSSISMQNMRLKWVRDKQFNVDVLVFGQDFCSNYFEYRDETLFEKGFIGDIGVQESYLIENALKNSRTYSFDINKQIYKRYLLDSLLGSNLKLEEFEIMNLDEDKVEFSLKVLLTPRGEKSIVVVFSDVKLLAQTSVYMNLFYFVLLDDSCYPIIEDFEILPMSIIWEIKNAMVCIPTKKNKHVLVTRGEINIRYYRYRMLSFPRLYDKFFQLKNNNNPNNREKVDSYSYHIEFQKVEIFLCELAELIKLKFNQVRKRNMILPFTLFYGSKNFISLLSSKKDCIYYLAENEFSIEQTILRFSYKDLMLLYEALNYQKEEFSKIENWQIDRAKTDQLNDTKTLDYIDNDKTYNFTINGLQTCIINDSEDCYVPVLDFTIYEGQVTVLRKNKLGISALLTTSFFYYNPFVSHWEPFVENVGFMIDINYAERGNPKIYAVVQMNDKVSDILNINISMHMIKILNKTLKIWQSDFSTQFSFVGNMNPLVFQKEESKNSELVRTSGLKEVAFSTLESKVMTINRENSESFRRKTSVMLVEEEDVVEYVSPYTIKNETGYPIEIERDYDHLIEVNQKKRYVLQNGHTMNLQFEMDLESIFNKEGKVRNHKKIKVRIAHPQHMVEPIEKIDMDHLRIRKIDISLGNTMGSKTSFAILTNISFLGSGKLLTISSDLCFINTTNKKLQIKLLDMNEIDLMYINPNETYVVPFDKVHKNFAFRFVKECEESGGASPNKWSDMLALNKLSIQNCKCYELAHDDYFTLLKIIKENGRCMVYFEAPFLFKNCLPMEISLQISSDSKSQPQKLNLSIQEEYQEHTISTSSKVYLKAQIIGFKLTEKHLVYSSSESNAKSNIIAIEDYRTGKGIIEVFMQEPEISGSCKRFSLYSKMFIVNETNYELAFLYNYEKKKYLVPGQILMDPVFSSNQTKQALGNIFDLEKGNKTQEKAGVSYGKVLLLGGIHSKNLMVAFTKRLNILSKEINLNAVGSTPLELSGGQDGGFYEFGINLSNICIDHRNCLFSKILRISPRYVIVNRTEFDLQIIQENCPQDIKILTPENRLPFFWTDEQKARYILMKVSKGDGPNQQIWGWSGSLDISCIGVISFSLRNNEDKDSIIYMQGDIRIDNHILYVIFTQCDEKNANYLIVNDLNDVDIFAFQSCCPPEKALYIPRSSKKIYAWDKPIYPKDIRIDLRFESPQYEAEIITINFDKMDTGDVGREFYVQSKQGQIFPCFRFFVNAFIEGSTKKLRFFKDDPLTERLRKENKINLQLEINLKALGFSLIGEYNKKRLEILYLYFNSIEFIILETQLLRTYQLRIKYFCFDNNTFENTVFPVAFTPTMLEYIKKKDNKFHLDVVVEQNILAKNILLLKSIQADLLPCTIRVNDELIEILVNFIKGLMDIIWNADSQKPTASSLVQVLYGDFPTERNYLLKELMERQSQMFERFEWETKELPSNIRYIYISEIIFSPISLNSSFQRKPKSQKSDPFFVMTFLNALGIALSNIDDAPIKLNGIQLINFFDTTDGIITKLGMHYKEALINSLLQVIGSIDILGNPVGLMKHLAAGVFDLIDKPIEGFVKGPLEGGFGIARGAGSFLKNTVAGTFNSVQKITGSFATGLSSLSLDDEYLAQREKNKMIKPKHALDGLGQGMISLASGVGKGLTGILTKPYEGYKKAGFGGILKGSLQGIAGLVVKPVAGVFDATSKAAEGIKNTATHFDEKPSEKRVRFLRVFYNKEKYFKSYSKRDSEIMSFLMNYKKEKFHNLSMIENFELSDGGRVQFLILTIQVILLFEFPKLIFDIKVNNLQKIEQCEQGIKIRIFQTSKKLKKNEILIRIPTENDRQYLFDMITEMMEYSLEKYQV